MTQLHILRSASEAEGCLSEDDIDRSSALTSSGWVLKRKQRFWDKQGGNGIEGVSLPGNEIRDYEALSCE
jgi:hypothetical protein